MQGWVDERTADGQTDGKMDPHLFGGYNIIPCHFFVAGHKNMIKKRYFIHLEQAETPS